MSQEAIETGNSDTSEVPLEFALDDIHLKNNLYARLNRIQPSFSQRKLSQVNHLSIEEEVEELYKEKFELEFYVKDLLKTNYFLVANYDERARYLSEKIAKKKETFSILKQNNEMILSEIKQFETNKEANQNFINSLNLQIGRMELKVNYSTQRTEDLNEGIFTLSDYEDKLYELREEISLNSDLINNLKIDYFDNKNKLLILKQKSRIAEHDKNRIKAGVLKCELRLQTLFETEKREAKFISQIIRDLNSCKRSYQHLLAENEKKTDEKNRLIKRNAEFLTRKSSSNNSSSPKSQREAIQNSEIQRQTFEYEKKEKKNNLKKEIQDLELKFDGVKSPNIFNSIKTPQRENITVSSFRKNSLHNKNTSEAKRNSVRKKRAKHYDEKELIFIETLHFFQKNSFRILLMLIIMPIIKRRFFQN